MRNEAIEKRLWRVADQLRSNGNFPRNEYFLTVMGIIFLRHAFNRYMLFKDGIEASLPKRGGVARPLTKEYFTKRSAIYLRPEARFGYLTGLSWGVDCAGKIIGAMESIEREEKSPQDVVTFYGQEKIKTTIRLAKMNLAVHGLEGDIKEAITYYQDLHDMLGKADYVMANPPFNVSCPILYSPAQEVSQ